MKLISPDELELAIEAVAAGSLVVLPTQRWYMICANARDSEACARIFAGKGRPRSKSLAFVLPDMNQVTQLFVMSPQARLLASTFWPGDLGLILPWRDLDVGQNHMSVGVPNALVTVDDGPLGLLALKSPVPIATASANISDKTRSPGPAITTAGVEQFAIEADLEIAYCVDGGVCPLAQHLTIVDCTAHDSNISRHGVIHERAVRAALAAALLTEASGS